MASHSNGVLYASRKAAAPERPSTGSTIGQVVGLGGLGKHGSGARAGTCNHSPRPGAGMKCTKKREEGNLRAESHRDRAHKPPVLSELLERMLPVLRERDDTQIEGQQPGSAQYREEGGSQELPASPSTPYSFCFIRRG